MKKKLQHLTILLSIISVLTFTFFPTSTVFAATCTGSGCNGMDPQGTTCWNDAYTAVMHYGSDGIMVNRNMYSSGCIANWSKTQNPTTTYLAAETVGVYTYDGGQPYLIVWNNMWDGSGTVCTRGYKGSSYRNYNVSSTSACA